MSPDAEGLRELLAKATRINDVVQVDVAENQPLIVAAINALPDLLSRIEELEEGLRPFAEWARNFDRGADPTGLKRPGASDFRAARALLTPKGSDHDERS